MRKEIVDSIVRVSGLSAQEVDKLIEVPPKEEMGDYAFPVFVPAKEMGESPVSLSGSWVCKINESLPKGVSNVVSNGAYMNFFEDKKDLAKKVLKMGKIKKKKGKKIMIEFPSPNTNKPLHLGHLRNMAIGESVSRILEIKGDKVIRVNLNQDRGVHICKSMVAYSKLGNGKNPGRVKSDHFVGDYYVKFNEKVRKDKKWEEMAQECLRKWENGDKKIVALWKKMRKWALDGFAETYRVFGIKHDKEYSESEIYTKGRDIIMKGLGDGIFQKKKEGAVFIDLAKEGLGEKILLRADGTSVYMTQDLYLAKKKAEDFKLDGSIYVVGNEQNYHFDVLFSILRRLGFEFADDLHHLSYGMVELPEGKMKSREGKVVDADDIIEDVRELAKEEIVRRGNLSRGELERRSLVVALGAIKYLLLKQDVRRNMVFNPNEAIRFEGDTGPYLLYTYARASSIVRKVGGKKRVKIVDLKPEEIRLVKKLASFYDVVDKAYGDLAPNLVANYCFELAQVFNEFYHSCVVIGSDKEGFRLALVDKFREVLKEGLHLLGIETLEEM